jgi:hypothetical protein
MLPCSQRLSGTDLVRIVKREELDKDGRIKCEHVAVGWRRESLPSRVARSGPSAHLGQDPDLALGRNLALGNRHIITSSG